MFYKNIELNNRSLITERGGGAGATKREEGGKLSFTPTKIGGGKCFRHAKEQGKRDTYSSEAVLIQDTQFSHTEGGVGVQNVPFLKCQCEKFYPVLRGPGDTQNDSDP